MRTYLQARKILTSKFSISDHVKEFVQLESTHEPNLSFKVSGMQDFPCEFSETMNKGGSRMLVILRDKKKVP